MESIRNGQIIYKPLGLSGYNPTWELQKELFQTMVHKKLHNEPIAENYLITCEHPHVITLGKSGNEGNLTAVNLPGVEYVKIDRGGDITYHGPGQLVVYPILDLEQFGLNLKSYIHILEEAVIQTLKVYGLESGRIKEYTGVWLRGDTPDAAKIAAIGVKSSRHITMHGLAFNIQPQLHYFDLIIPCGIVGKKVTSLEHELGHPVDFKETEELFLQQFTSLLLHKKEPIAP